MKSALGLLLLLVACRTPAPVAPAPAEPEVAPAVVEAPAPVVNEKRPQTPVPPFPYASEDVTYTNPASGLTLAGTLTQPSEGGPHPAVVLISGSGTQDRDGTIFEHRPFAVMADAFTRRGIAVLRVDDRGAGGSDRGPLDVTSADFATDVGASVAFLRGRDDIDPARIGLVGHSEGGMIAPMVAAEDHALAGIVLLAGPGITGKELLIAQSRAVLEARGADAGMVDTAVAQQTKVMEAIATAPSVEEARTQVAAAMGVGDNEAIRKTLEAQIIPWTVYFVKHDPKTVLPRVTCPVLALNGTLDIQVIAGPNLQGIEAALASGGNQDVTVRELDGLNHLFQPATKGTVAEYETLTTTFDEGALTTIGDWLLEKL